mgnify:CR=1 FL=1
MLFLGRNPGQGVVLRLPGGGEVRIVLVRCGNGLRFQIDAPRDVVILRDELADWGGRRDEAQP